MTNSVWGLAEVTTPHQWEVKIIQEVGDDIKNESTMDINDNWSEWLQTGLWHHYLLDTVCSFC